MLTAREKVLLHLMTLQRYSQDPDAPKAATQEGIAEVIDVGRNNVAKIVTSMQEAGDLETHNRHVKGLPSVRKVYFLSQKGFSEALALKKEMESTPLTILDMKGEKHQETFGRVSGYLPKRYTLLELAMGVYRGTFDCPSFHEGKIKQERRFVDFTDRKPTVRNFFGRETELALLNELVASDATRLIVVQGIPGIGKTTLLAKFAQDNRDRINIFWFKVHEWVNVKSVLRPIAEFLSQIGKKGLEWYLNQTEVPNIGEVCHILEGELKEVSAVLILDDVQKAEKGILDLLAALMAVLENAPQMRLICTSRETLTFYNRALVPKGAVTEMVLDGLDRESSMRLMRERALPEEAMEQIFAVTNGHPLFMELVEEPQRAMGKNVRMFIEQEVYSKLELSERRILEIASVFRYPVPTDSFFIMEEEIAKEQGQSVREKGYQDYMVDYDTIDVLIRKAMLKESSGRMVGMHDVLRDFFYSRLSPRQRAVHHKAAAKIYLQDANASSYVEALYHSMLANDFEVAMRIAAGNGRDIIAKGYANMLAPLLRELSVRCRQSNLLERLEVLSLEGEILDIQGEWDLALSTYREVLGLASPERDKRVIADTNRRIGVIMMRRFDYESASRYLETAKVIAGSNHDQHTLMQVHYDLGGMAERRGQCAESLAHFERSETLARSMGEDVGRGKALYGEGRVFGTLLDLDQAVRFKREALEVLQRTSDSNEIAKVLSSMGSDLWNIGIKEEGIHALERAVELANSIGDLNTLGYALFNLAGAYIEMGELGKAEAAVDQVSSIAKKLDEQFLLAGSHLHRGYIYHRRKEWEWAKEEFAMAIMKMRQAGSPPRLCYWLVEVGKVYLENLDNAGAKLLFKEALELANRSGQETLRRQVEEATLSVNE
jgi:tetratricopeptide (TPR) repeat protein